MVRMASTATTRVRRVRPDVPCLPAPDPVGGAKRGPLRRSAPDDPVAEAQPGLPVLLRLHHELGREAVAVEQVALGHPGLVFPFQQHAGAHPAQVDLERGPGRTDTGGGVQVGHRLRHRTPAQGRAVAPPGGHPGREEGLGGDRPAVVGQDDVAPGQADVLVRGFPAPSTPSSNCHTRRGKGRASAVPQCTSSTGAPVRGSVRARGSSSRRTAWRWVPSACSGRQSSALEFSARPATRPRASSRIRTSPRCRSRAAAVPTREAPVAPRGRKQRGSPQV